MLRTGAMVRRARAVEGILPAVLLLCLAASGCHNTCVSGFWNQSGSGVSVSNTSCTLSTAKGAVVLQMATPTVDASPRVSAPLFNSPPVSAAVQHIFVTLAGVEAHSSATADSESSGWQELASGLAGHPVQVNLLGVAEGSRSTTPLTADEFPLSILSPVPASVRADEYRQLRIRFAGNQLAPGEAIPEANACGDARWQCIVLAGGVVRPLIIEGAAPEFCITSEHIASGSFRVLPGAVTHLFIELDSSSSVAFAANGPVRLTPVFKVGTASTWGTGKMQER